MSLTEANTNPIFQRAPSVQAATLTDADTTVPKTLFVTASTEGALVDQISATNTSSADEILSLTLTDDATGTDYHIGDVAVPANSGTDSGVTAAFDLFTAVFVLQSGGLPMPPVGILKVSAKTGITASETITLLATGGDY